MGCALRDYARNIVARMERSATRETRDHTGAPGFRDAASRPQQRHKYIDTGRHSVRVLAENRLKNRAQWRSEFMDSLVALPANRAMHPESVAPHRQWQAGG